MAAITASIGTDYSEKDLPTESRLELDLVIAEQQLTASPLPDRYSGRSRPSLAR
jgi:hypothetical protein